MSGGRHGGPTELYRFYDSEGRLLYVGITASSQLRVAKHRVTQPWWEFAATMTIQRFATRRQAEMAERIAIRDEDPIFNAQRLAPESLGHPGYRPVVTKCWVCGQPILELMDETDETEQPRLDHDACSESAIYSYERGLEAARKGWA